MYDALANSRAPLATIIDHLKVPRSGTHHPLFQVALNYRQDNSTRSSFGDVPIEWLDGTNLGYPYDMKFDVNDTPNGTRFCLVTQKYLYGTAEAERMIRWYEATLTAFLSDPNIPIVSCPLSKPEDDANAISMAKGPRLAVDAHRTLAHQIHEMATLYPDSLAITDSIGGRLTYSEMMARSEQIATLLQRTVRIRTGDKVAVLLTAVPDLACSLIAIMRLGLVYVPLDTCNSTERLEAILSECQPSTILCHGATEAQTRHLAAGGVPFTNIEDLGNANSVNALPPGILAAPDQVGFVMYTGGTTGPPKGILLTHSGLMNQISGITSQFGIGREVVLQSASPESDFSLEQMFVSLANGGTLVVAPQSAKEDTAEVADIMLNESITYTSFTTSEYLDLLKCGSKVLSNCTSWNFAFASHEKVTARFRRAMKDLELPGLELVSVYGPVEASISCSRVRLNYQEAFEDFSDVTGERFCGPMMPNYSVVIVDQELRPVPTGYLGEICIAGPGLAKGYLNNPREKSRRFVANTSQSTDEINRGRSRLFRSGDKGRVLEDSTVHFIGRLTGDREVIIQDKPFNLGEIAEVIIREASPTVLDAAVSWRADTGVLIAFVTVEDEAIGDIDVFLHRLKATVPLPTHMIRDVILPVRSVPRTLDGRKDLRALDNLLLPECIPNRITTETFSPLELRVKSIRESLIRTDSMANLKPETEIFCAGGNSVLLIPLQAALQADLRSSLSLPDLFQTPRNTWLQATTNPGVVCDSNTVPTEEMKRLPQEVVDKIAGHLPARHEGKRILPILATFSSSWQHAIELFTFQSLHVTSDGLDDFYAAFVGQKTRRRFLRDLHLDIVLPRYSDEDCAKYETAHDRAANSDIFSHQVSALLQKLSQWPAGGRLNLVIGMYSPMDGVHHGPDKFDCDQYEVTLGRRQDIFGERYAYSYLRFAGTVSVVPCVTEPEYAHPASTAVVRPPSFQRWPTQYKEIGCMH
ncbi:hypothetical protein INS49_004548 [Diaporthe citri]|uniref:uncharacterized protein n=1 Tax=Diaporthe citri TaxID=83186 RepID=UPI001C7FE61A|nr:uncharacterized protein INS49_004548 [Diaporthe citri]KAG6354531.1 hypothetical protein INS49_004548 [Diaporthe citri]